MTGEPASLTARLAAAAHAVGEQARAAGPSERWTEYAVVLLADCLAAVTAAGERIPSVGGVRSMERAAALALAAHHQDRDDLHWRAGVHPGSIIWPVVCSADPAIDAATRRAAAAAGYAAMVGTARVLGPAHGRHWHLTATAGTAGAGMAAAVLAGLSPQDCATAMSHALATAGGVGQVLVERTAGAAVNRAGAVIGGILAAQAAAAGLTAAEQVLEGPRGLLPATGAWADRADPDYLVRAMSEAITSMPDALTTTSVRLYPTTGFLQSAVAGVRRLRAQVTGQPDRILVTLAAPVAALTGERGVRDEWWSARRCLAAAWLAEDVWQVADRAAGLDAELASLMARVSVVSADQPLWSAAVQCEPGGQAGVATTAAVTVATPPGWDALTDRAGCLDKWTAMGVRPELVLDRARELLIGPVTASGC